jgi:ABC-2 type transport system permease protein
VGGSPTLKEAGLMVSKTWALTMRDLKHFRRSKMEVFLLTILPLIMLVLFGQAFNKVGSTIAPTDLSGAPDYVSFLAIGLLALTVLMTCMYSGISIVMDHRIGFLKKLVVSPVNRSSISMSRAWSAVIKATILSIAMFGLAILFSVIPGLTGLTLKSGFSITDFFGIVIILFLLSWIFSAFIVTVSLGIEKAETISGLINLVNMPLMFISAVLLPTILMPDWLRVMADWNPLTWASDAMRQLAFSDPAPTNELWLDLALLSIAAAMMVAICITASGKLLKKK